MFGCRGVARQQYNTAQQPATALSAGACDVSVDRFTAARLQDFCIRSTATFAVTNDAFVTRQRVTRGKPSLFMYHLRSNIDTSHAVEARFPTVSPT